MKHRGIIILFLITLKCGQFVPLPTSKIRQTKFLVSDNEENGRVKMEDRWGGLINKDIKRIDDGWRKKIEDREGKKGKIVKRSNVGVEDNYNEKIGIQELPKTKVLEPNRPNSSWFWSSFLSVLFRTSPPHEDDEKIKRDEKILFSPTKGEEELCVKQVPDYSINKTTADILRYLEELKQKNDKRVRRFLPLILPGLSRKGKKLGDGGHYSFNVSSWSLWNNNKKENETKNKTLRAERMTENLNISNETETKNKTIRTERKIEQLKMTKNKLIEEDNQPNPRWKDKNETKNERVGAEINTEHSKVSKSKLDKGQTEGNIEHLQTSVVKDDENITEQIMDSEHSEISSSNIDKENKNLEKINGDVNDSEKSSSSKDDNETSTSLSSSSNKNNNEKSDEKNVNVTRENLTSDNHPSFNKNPARLEEDIIEDEDSDNDDEDRKEIDYDALECGTKNVEARIIGGSLAVVGEWPWQVALVQSSSRMPFCGASLINSRFLITAAHCATLMPRHQIEAWLGSHNMSLNHEEGRVIVRVSQVVTHHQYDRRTLANDLALLRLVHPVQNSHTIRPVCLPESQEWDDGLNNGIGVGVVAGWGITQEQGNTSDVLRQVRLPLLSVSECRRLYRNINPVNENNLCTIYRYSTPKDSCKGDSGGPLVVEGSDGRWSQVGVISFGYGCGRPGYPAVYTRLTQYLLWIYINIVQIEINANSIE